MCYSFALIFQSESARQAEALRVTRDKVSELTEELRNKEALYTHLQAEYAKVSKDISRYFNVTTFKLSNTVVPRILIFS